MSALVLSFVILLFLIMINGFFSMSEMAVVSSRKTKLKMLHDEGHKSSSLVLTVANAPTKFLSSIQIGITLIGIMSGAFGEASISKIFEEIFSQSPMLMEYAGTISAIIVVTIVTVLSILFGELIPKRIALQNPEWVALKIIYPIQFISTIFQPVVRVFAFLTELLLKPFGMRNSTESGVTYDEIKYLLQEGVEYGIFKRQQKEMLVEIMDLQNTEVKNMMLPRSEMKYIEMNSTPKKIREKILEYSDCAYIPVCDGGIDNISGTINTLRLLKAYYDAPPKTISRFIEKPLFVPEKANPLKVLELFRENKTHVAYVVDEYGLMVGLVTLNDISEEIIGNIPSSKKRIKHDIVRRDDGSFLVDGIVSIEEFEKKFSVKISLYSDVNTLAGFIMAHLGKIPTEGESFSFKRWRFEIVDMDGNKIDKVVVRKSK